MIQNFVTRGGLLFQKLDQLDQIGWPQFEEYHAAFQFLGDESHGRTDHDELSLIEQVFIHVAQPPPDLRRFAQRLVKILQVENASAFVRDDMVERGTRLLGTGRCLGQTPGPDRNIEPLRHFA